MELNGIEPSASWTLAAGVTLACSGGGAGHESETTTRESDVALGAMANAEQRLVLRVLAGGVR